MKNLGCFLMILGVGSFVLPLFGLQFKIMRLFGESPTVAIIMAIVGIALFAMSGGKGKRAAR